MGYYNYLVLTKAMKNFIKLFRAIAIILIIGFVNVGCGSNEEQEKEQALPPETPGAPTVNSGLWQLSVTWEPVAGADQYEVYCGTTKSPATIAVTTALTTATITELIEGTTYYIRLRAKNKNGISDYGPSASNSPKGGNPSLYHGGVKIGEQNLENSLTYIWNNAVNEDHYHIVIDADESISPRQNLHYGDRTVNITLHGYNSEKTIELNANGSMFIIGRNVTLTLGAHITLNGRSANSSPLVRVGSGGTLIMNDGAKISGNVNAESAAIDGGGVYINGGTFIMYGGEISGNSTTYPSSSFGGGGVCVGDSVGDSYTGGSIYYGGTFIMYGGKISGNSTNSTSSGGGVYIIQGTFTLYNGEISGNSSSVGGGVCLGVNGGTSNPNFIMHGGTINGNTAGNGGGVYVINFGRFTMNSGTISGNTASNNGGGVFINSDRRNNTANAMNGGIISGNNARNGGGVYVTGTQDSQGIAFKKESGVSGSNIIYGAEAVGVDAKGTPLRNTATNDNNPGHAVYALFSSQVRMRNTTAWDADYINTFTSKGISFNGNPPFGQ